jgi:hypothetical protein
MDSKVHLVTKVREGKVEIQVMPEIKGLLVLMVVMVDR